MTLSSLACRPFAISLVLLAIGPSVSAQQSPFVPPYTCSNEQDSLNSWSRVAGTASESKLLTTIPNATIESLSARDGQSLKGISARSSANTKDALLVIQGNGWSLRWLAGEIARFPTESLDVYAFDFRGYGLSKPGTPAFGSIITDYQDIASALQTKGYRNLYLYAFSFGGVIAANAFPTGAPFHRIVLDAVPSHPRDYGFICIESYDPPVHLPDDCSSYTFMHGTSDGVVPRKYAKENIDAIRKCGGVLDIEVARGHPFQMEWDASREKRVKAIMEHLRRSDE